MTTLQDIQDKVIQLGKEYPHATYPSSDPSLCYYTRGRCGKGSGCLLGQALQELGFTEQLKELDNRGSMSIFQALRKLSIPLDDANILYFLGNIQNQQDDGVPWGGGI